MDLTRDLKAIICESARVFGFELKEKQIVIEEHFLLQCQVSFCNFLRFLWSAEVVQRHNIGKADDKKHNFQAVANLELVKIYIASLLIFLAWFLYKLLHSNFLTFVYISFLSSLLVL